MNELAVTVAITATNHAAAAYLARADAGALWPEFSDQLVREAAAYLARADAGALAPVIERALLEDLTARLQAERGAKHPLSDSFAVTCLRANMAERGG